MALYLPGALGPIARLCSSGDGRYAMAGVRVLDPCDGTFRCEVTDGRSLLICQGVCPIDDDTPGNFPAIIPAGLWKDTFDEKVKDPLSRRFGRFGQVAPGGALAPVRIQVEPYQQADAPCTLQVGDAVMRKGRVLEGRFPDVNQVLPKGQPAFAIRVNPHYLATLLEVLNRLLADEPAVTLCFWTPDQPMAIVAKDRTNGICYDCLLMPLAPPPPPPRIAEEEEAEEAGPTEEEQLADAEPEADEEPEAEAKAA